MSVESAEGGKQPSVECIIPILSVKDLAASLDFYLRVLGFSLHWGGNPDDLMASVSRDNRSIMLCQGGQGHSGTWVWIGVTDVRPEYTSLKAGGAKIVMEPTNHSWALEFRVEDPDGHVLRFGSEPDPNLPYADRGDG